MKIVHIVTEVVIHSYREDFFTSLSIWVYGESRLSGRDTVWLPPANNYF
jgi:hypothetical protein